MSVLRFDLVPAADDPALILAIVGRVAAGQRDAEAIAADLDRPLEQVRPALDAAAWLGLVWAGAEPSLTARGLELSGATQRQQMRLYAEAIWRQPLARALLRGHGAPDLQLALRVLRDASPAAPELRLQRQARCLLALCLPALTSAPRRTAGGGEQVTLPLSTPGRPADAGVDEPVQILAEALLDHGELAPPHLPALLARAGQDSQALASLIDELVHTGRARREGDQLVAGEAPESAGDQPCVERLLEGGLALAFPSSLADLGAGITTLNHGLRPPDPEAPRLPAATDARRVVYGGLMVPGERPLRAIPDALSLRLRALSCAPAFTLLGAALVLDRHASGELAIERHPTGRNAGPMLRWRRADPLPLLDALGAFASALGHVVLRPARGGLDGATLANTAAALGLAAWTGNRLRLDEQLFTRLQRDAEARLLLDALEPVATRLSQWLEARAPRKRTTTTGERVFVYGSLLRGQRHAARLAGLPFQPATTRGRLWLLHEGYPALVPAARGPVLHGELIEGVSDDLLAELDAFEELDRGLYSRVRVRVRVGSRSLDAWAYVQDEVSLRARGCAPLDLDDWRSRPAGLAP